MSYFIELASVLHTEHSDPTHECHSPPKRICYTASGAVVPTQEVCRGLVLVFEQNNHDRELYNNSSHLPTPFIVHIQVVAILFSTTASGAWT